MLKESVEVWERQRQEAVDAVKQQGGNKAAAARELGISRSTLRRRLETVARHKAKKPKVEGPELPDFPDDDIPTEQLLDTMEHRFEKRQAAAKARQWFKIKMPDSKPVGLAWVGDPHVDDNGCNIRLLRHHAKLLAETEGAYGINLGDLQNNWTGRLMRLYADQDTSLKTASKLAKWYMLESGIDWLVWILGNHDLWTGLPDVAEAVRNKVYMQDWQAQFCLAFPGGEECRIWAAHNFPGNSMWNTLHSAQRAAHTKAQAHIYACGHTHNYAIHQEESASKEFTYWLIRARGYKYLDDYAEKLGHASQEEGATVLSVIDPNASSMAGFVQCFTDLEEGLEFLTWKRSRG